MNAMNDSMRSADSRDDDDELVPGPQDPTSEADDSDEAFEDTDDEDFDGEETDEPDAEE